MYITEKVIKLGCTKGAYAYAVKGEDGVTLIDTGIPGRGKWILRELAACGIKPSDIKRILLTHGDADHTGNMAFLSEKSGCDIYIGENDLPFAKGEKWPDGFKGFLSLLIKPRQPKEIKVLPAGPIAGIEILKTPGHTLGHVCYRFENVLFAGDLGTSKNGKMSPAQAIMTLDKKMALKSYNNVNLKGVDFVCPAHGEPVKSTSDRF